MKKVLCPLMVMISLLVFSFQSALAAPAAPAPAGMVSASTSEQGFEDLPLAARYGLSAALGRDNRAYHLTEHQAGWQGQNSAQSWEIGFSGSGVDITDRAGQWGLNLSAWGYGQDLSPATPARPTALGNRVEYRRGPLTEWYVNGPLGLQQGFTLESRPDGVQPVGQALRLCLDLVGGLTAVVDPDRRGVSLHRENGQGLARYAGLTVLDAQGREAPAWLEAELGRLSIVVDDRNLKYPLVIDPFIQTAKLTASDGAADDKFGYSISVSGDTVVVGAPNHDSQHGSAYVFIKSPGGWADMTQTAKLTASDGAADDNFGNSVSISGDVVVAGAYYDDDHGTNSGSAYVFVEPVAGWSGNLTETAKLTASDGAEGDYFGQSVSISGGTVVVGACNDETYRGSAYVFVEPVAGWSGNLTETAKLTASDSAIYDYLGYSVSVSGDTVVAGAFGDDAAGDSSGSAYVFVKPGSVWVDMPQTAKLTASDGEAGDWFGASVSISGDVVVGGAYHDDDHGLNSGSAYVFVKPGSVWVDMPQTAKLTASDGEAGDWFGTSVSISGDMVVTGAYGDDGAGDSSGSAYVFVKPGSGWADMTQTAKLTASDGEAGDWFGTSVSISGDTVVVGAYGDGSNQGSAYVFDTRKKTGSGFLNLLLTD